MKKGLLVLVLALTVGVTAFRLARHQQACDCCFDDPVLLDSLPELAWLRSELKLNETQFAKVRELHLAYRPTCAEMCARISAAQQALEVLAGSQRALSGPLSAALQHHAQVRAECREAMLRHLYETAAVLGEDQARRYLELMLPIALESSTGVDGHSHGH